MFGSFTDGWMKFSSSSFLDAAVFFSKFARGSLFKLFVFVCWQFGMTETSLFSRIKERLPI